MSLAPRALRDHRRLQDGIYFRPGERPGSCWRLLLLDIEPDTTRPEAGAALASLWAMLQELRRGVVRDLQPAGASDPEVTVPSGGLTCLLGFGMPLFDRYPELAHPSELRRLDAAGPFKQIKWADPQRHPDDAPLAIQLIADTNLAVDRAVVETAMLIGAGALPLRPRTFYGGFNRDDGLSWLGFADGISNVDPDLRGLVIEVVAPESPWMQGGTYMTFLRLAIDLEAWRRLPRREQELRVGREKLTGCPLVVRVSGGPVVTLEGCPVGANPPGSPQYVDAPPGLNGTPRASHIHLARKHDEAPGENRIFRQGYEFVELGTGNGLRLGLNFVSFQRDLQRVSRILESPGWLGGANFGGEEPLDLLTLLAGGFYAIPPAADPFPGAEIF